MTSTGDPQAGCDLHLPEDVNYTCHQSGLCCPVFPRIPVDAPSAERLHNLNYESLKGSGCEVRSFEEAVAREPGDEGQLVLKRDPADGNCVFYGPDKLCAIHKAQGEPAKPQVCRDFPYRYRNTPGGIYVGLSFVCPSVRGNRGRRVVEQREELAQACERANRIEDLSAPVLLNRKLQISWPDYLALEQGLFDLFDRGDVPLSLRLIAFRVLIDFVDLAHQAMSGPYEPMSGPRLAPEGEITEIVATLRRAGYADVFKSSRREVGSPMLRRMFLGMLVGLANSMWQEQGRIGMVLSLLGQYARHAAAVGGVRLKPLKTTVSHRTLNRVRFPVDKEGAELVERYLRHAIFRKDLLTSPDLTRGVNLFLVNAALLRWYAAAVAADAGRTTPETADFSEAVRYVETYFGMQSRFYTTISGHPGLEEVIDSFTSRRNFPFIVMAEELF